MSELSPARYRTKDWSSYNAALRKRGSMLIWIDRDMAWLAPAEGCPGRPSVFSEAAIQFCLSVKVLFKLVGIDAVAIGARSVRALIATVRAQCRRDRPRGWWPACCGWPG